MPQAPNMQSFIAPLVNKYSAEWAKCKAPNDDGSFIRAVAQELSIAHGKRWGLNAKRDTSTLSKDVIDYYVGPTDRHVEVYDVIAGHEGPNPSIVWNDVTDYTTIGNPGTARFVDPFTNQGYNGSPIGNANLIPVSAALAQIAQKIGHELSATEINTYAARAKQLGWNGTGFIDVIIVNQILAEIGPPNVGNEIICSVITANSYFPVGTKLTIKVG